MPSPPWAGRQEPSGRSLFEDVIIRDKDAQEASFLDESAATIAITDSSRNEVTSEKAKTHRFGTPHVHSL